MNSLLEETKSLLRESQESRRAIADNSGVGYAWLSKFARGVIPDPGVNRIEKLNRYLRGINSADG